jgi:hypothetical protein
METSVLTLTRQRKNQKDTTVVVKHDGKDIKSVKLQGREILNWLDIGYIQDLQEQIWIQYWEYEDDEFTPSTF